MISLSFCLKVRNFIKMIWIIVLSLIQIENKMEYIPTKMDKLKLYK